MSNRYYNQKWQEAISDLLEQVDEQNQPLEENRNDKGLTYKRSDLEWFQYYAGLYIRYIDCYKRLEDCYDQLAHPQKRKLLKEMLDNSMVRMCEVKQNLVRYSTHSQVVQSDFINLDEVVMELKLTPKVLEVPVPRYFKEDRKDKIEERDQLVIQFMEDYHGTTAPEEEVLDDRCVIETTTETTVRIIQKLERGRQGIIRMLELQKLKNKLQKEKSARISEINGEEEESQKASVVIQKYWRAFASRKLVSEWREEQLRFLGMEKEPMKSSVQEIAKKQRTRLKLLQIDHENTFKLDHGKIKKDVYLTEEHNIKTSMLDERRKWIQRFLEMNEFADLPKAVEDFYQKDLKEDDKENTKPNKKKDDKKESKGKPKKNEVDKFLDEHDRRGPSELVLQLQKNIEEHTVKWAPRDQAESNEQKYDTDIARNSIRPEVEQQIRQKVDEMIALELDNMRIKYGVKKKKDKKRKPKKRKEKKVKIPLGLGKRDPKDLLAELVQAKVVKVLQPAKMNDLIGQHNPLGTQQERQATLMPDPSIAQLRQVLIESIAIPLGSTFAKERLEKNSWFLFYGPMGSGKTLAVRSLQSECNALIFDLTPSNLQERFDKNALKKLFWMVMIVAKEFQPSIVLIDDFQQIFSAVKKKKKDAGSNYAPKLKKSIVMLKKKNKLWTKNDQIAVIACSNKPYEASTKELKKLFDRKYYFPYPNYATRKLIFQTLAERKLGALPESFPFNTVAHITEGFTGGSFKMCIDKVLTEARCKRIAEDKLRLSEFVYPLANTYCTYAHQYEKFREFTDEITGLKERRLKKLNPAGDEKKPQKSKK